MTKQFTNAATMDETKKILKEADKYIIENHFHLTTCSKYTYGIWQPYIKGFSNESLGPGSDTSPAARIWIDPSLKK